MGKSRMYKGRKQESKNRFLNIKQRGEKRKVEVPWMKNEEKLKEVKKKERDVKDVNVINKGTLKNSDTRM